MNSEQLRLFLNGAFGNEAGAREINKELKPYLRAALQEILDLIDQLPNESLARQREWRQLLKLVEQKLERYSDAFGVELSRQLPCKRIGCGRRDDDDAEICGAASRGLGATRADHGGLDQVLAQHKGERAARPWACLRRMEMGRHRLRGQTVG